MSIYAEEPLNMLDTATEHIIVLDTISELQTIVLDSNAAIGCNNLTTVSDFDNLKNQLETIIFETKRLDFLNQTLPNQCLTTHQFAELIQKMDYEENKLSLIVNHATSIYNITELGSLKEELILQQSINALENFLQSDKYKQLINK